MGVQYVAVVAGAVLGKIGDAMTGVFFNMLLPTYTRILVIEEMGGSEVPRYGLHAKK